MELGNEDIRILRQIQNGIPLEKKPFQKIARNLGLNLHSLLDRLREFDEKGVISRFGASLNYRKLGYKANAMVVWDVSDERVDEIGEKISEFEEVTHCYLRPRIPGKWRYNLYCMIHAGAKKECEEIIHKIANRVGIEPEKYGSLYSVRAFKRKGIKL